MTKPIKHGVYDGAPARFTSDGGIEIWCLSDDGIWFEPSRPMQVYCYECGVLSKEKFDRLFGDLPPLPMHAFCREGWCSLLV